MILKLTFGQCVSLIFVYFFAKEVVWLIFQVFYRIAKEMTERKKGIFDDCKKCNDDHGQTENNCEKEKKRPIGFRSIDNAPKCKEES